MCGCFIVLKELDATYMYEMNYLEALRKKIQERSEASLRPAEKSYCV